MDDLFTKQKCDRCENDLKLRTMSWFNDDVLCNSCSNEERRLKLRLFELGFDTAKFEGINLSIESIKRMIKDSEVN